MIATLLDGIRAMQDCYGGKKQSMGEDWMSS